MASETGLSSLLDPPTSLGWIGKTEKGPCLTDSLDTASPSMTPRKPSMSSRRYRCPLSLSVEEVSPLIPGDGIERLKRQRRVPNHLV